PELAQPLGDDRGRARFLERQLGMGMKVAARVDQLLHVGRGKARRRHGRSPREGERDPSAIRPAAKQGRGEEASSVCPPHGDAAQERPPGCIAIYFGASLFSSSFRRSISRRSTSLLSTTNSTRRFLAMASGDTFGTIGFDSP